MSSNVNTNRSYRYRKTYGCDLVKCFDEFSDNLVKLSMIESPIDYLKRANADITNYLVRSLNSLTSAKREM